MMISFLAIQNSHAMKRDCHASIDIVRVMEGRNVSID